LIQSRDGKATSGPTAVSPDRDTRRDEDKPSQRSPAPRDAGDAATDRDTSKFVKQTEVPDLTLRASYICQF